MVSDAMNKVHMKMYQLKYNSKYFMLLKYDAILNILTQKM